MKPITIFLSAAVTMAFLESVVLPLLEQHYGAVQVLTCERVGDQLALALIPSRLPGLQTSAPSYDI